ncbi:hypothetical protein GLOTRDRAFT_115459 [Gloeophyllum trabeum ATCC 11539]|uniref:Amidohydrolase-related domain-containing protein n=1 Tax=Gloeophyllum trabeum (strain ATCC 11539 / FP-39264 / Madison 617) TaxID=670483 RepID=S7RSF4_GLOTA|nr:uncharacterized protein GLOTRDRAFT_115459 [Gloeophyllum trabeum ATCC 11539]EPQ57575.1 hypothetical protein GLOTRDRAFT_115459 [Gloeophyllum trabeum ATCC 11539]
MSSAAAIPKSPPSPGVGARRKGPKTLPKLPLSAFSPPNSGTSEKFPLPPSPSAVHPETIVDAEIVDVSAWKKDSGEELGGKISGLVLSLKDKGSEEAEKIVDQLETTVEGIPVIAALVPFTLEDGVPASAPSYLTKPSKVPVALSTSFSTPTAHCVSALSWALSQDRVVDISVQTDLQNGEAGWETLEDFMTKSTAELVGKGTIVLSNILPPPLDLSLPLVKLLTHYTYRAFQSHTAAISLFPNVYVKYLPPAWETDAKSLDDAQLKEWKRRIKMYLGHAIEAFGQERIIFGSSPAHPSLPSGTWYELARESLAELGIEQEGIDAVFGANAKKVYGGSS